MARDLLWRRLEDNDVRMWTLFSRFQLVRSLVRDARLAWALFRDARTPLHSKAILVGAVLLVISPINWIPSLVPVLGQMEDLALLSLGIQMFLRSVPAGLRAEHELRQRPRELRPTQPVQPW